jgi:prepilin-type N-terminal cleavage/methylation domain-containing protein
MNKGCSAFTLVELMIVVGIIGLVAMIAIPSMSKVRKEGRIAAYANDMRLASDAFEFYAMEHGDYPPDAMRGVPPPGMAAYLPKMDWTGPTPLGGRWDWERRTLGIGAGISDVGTDLRQEDFRAVDRKIDDGNLLTGRFRQIAMDRFTYVIED